MARISSAQRLSRLSLLQLLYMCLLPGACVLDPVTGDLEEAQLERDTLGWKNIVAASQPLATGTLRVNDVYFIPRRDGVSDAPLYATATGFSIVRRIPEQATVKVVVATPSSGRYRVDHAGTLGWMGASDLALRYRYDATLSAPRIQALARARAAMGMSYWWSNARWPSAGPTLWPARNTGTCSGSCGGSPPCKHAAIGGGPEYGADCSGFLSTIWGFPDYDSDTNPLYNGFATKTFAIDNRSWHTVSLSEALPGDAIVKHDEERKHIFLVATRRDSRQAFRTFECTGCAKGCRTLTRTIRDDDGWHAIRRTGW